MPTLSRSELLTLLNSRLDRSDVELVLFDLGLDRDNHPGATKIERLIALIEILERQRKVQALLSILASRPQLGLSDLALEYDYSLPATPTTQSPSPPIRHSLPPRNLHFAGRIELIATLEHALTSTGRATLTQPHALFGLGGTGKTQLALEYAYRHLSDYDLIAWLRAEDPYTLQADLAALAHPLGLPEQESLDPSLKLGAVRVWLETHPRWLLVFDNATDRASLREILPRAGVGHVLITSRNPTWSGLAQRLSVGTFSRTDAVAFLLQRTGQTEQDDAGQLADTLGDLPLALEQAAAYIEERGITLAAYLARYQQHHLDLLKRGIPSDNYPATVSTTWDLNFAAIRQTSLAATQLLTLCAFFAPDDIPLDLLAHAARHLPDPLAASLPDPLNLDDTIAILTRYSLVKRLDNSLSIHRLVQTVTRDHLTPDEAQFWTSVVTRLFESFYPENRLAQPPAWATYDRLHAHALFAEASLKALGTVADGVPRFAVRRDQYLSAGVALVGIRHAVEELFVEGQFSRLPSFSHNLLQKLDQLRQQLTFFQTQYPDLSSPVLLSLLPLLHQAYTNLMIAQSMPSTPPASGITAMPFLSMANTNIAMMFSLVNDPNWYSFDLPSLREKLERNLRLVEDSLGPNDPTAEQCRKLLTSLPS